MKALVLMLAVTGLACGERIPGASIDLVLHVTPLDPTSADLDGTTVSAGWLTISVAEVIECPSTASRVFNELSPIGSAWAHSTTSPTRIAAPHVVSLSTAADVALGTFAPPPGNWCSVHFSLGPADHDAVGIENTPMLNRTLVLEVANGATSSSIETVGLTLTVAPISLTEENLHGTFDVYAMPKTWLAQTHAQAPNLAGTASHLLSAVHPQ